jgi:esterase/lipase superfamily enzyme
LRNGIQAVIKERGGLPRMFDEIFLMAADDDHDAFELEHKLLPLPELGRNVHVYFNRSDTALVISDKTKANPTRLGSYGPRAPLTVPGNVELVDCSEVVGGLVEHGYFLDDSSTVRDVRAVLAGEAQDLIGGRRYLASQNKYVLAG